jgi:hypothetical protein
MPEDAVVGGSGGFCNACDFIWTAYYAHKHDRYDSACRGNSDKPKLSFSEALLSFFRDEIPIDRASIKGT